MYNVIIEKKDSKRTLKRLKGYLMGVVKEETKKNTNVQKEGK